MTGAHQRGAAMALATVTALATAVWTLRVFWNLGAATFFDEWVFNAIVLGSVALAAWRGIAVREDRVPWLLIASGWPSGSRATSGG